MEKPEGASETLVTVATTCISLPALQKRGTRQVDPVNSRARQMSTRSLMRICFADSPARDSKSHLRDAFPRAVSPTRIRPRKEPFRSFPRAVRFRDFYAHFRRIYWQANKFRRTQKGRVGVSAVLVEGVENIVFPPRPRWAQNRRCDTEECQRNLWEYFFFIRWIS